MKRILAATLLVLCLLVSLGHAEEVYYELLWKHETGDYVGSVSISSDGSYVAVGSGDKVYFFDRSGKLLWRYWTGGNVESVSVSGDGSYVVVSSNGMEDSEDGGWEIPPKVYFFDRSGKLLWSYETGDYVGSVSISSDGNYVAVGSGDKVYFFDRSGKLLWSYETDGYVCCVFISYGSHVAAGSGDGKIYFFAGTILSVLLEAEEKINLLKSKEYNTTEAEFLLERAKQALKAKNYGYVRSFAELAIARSEEILGEISSVEEALKSADRTFETLKSKGYEASEVEKLVNDAWQAFKAGDYSTAKSFAEDAKGKAEEILRGGDAASNALKAAKKAVSDAREKGYEVTNLENMLREAEAAFTAGDYSKAKELSEDAKNRAEMMLDVGEAISDAESALSATSERLLGFLALKLSRADALLSQAKEAFSSGNYAVAMRLALKAEEQAISRRYLALTYLIAAAVVITAGKILHFIYRQVKRAVEDYRRKQAEVIRELEELVQELERRGERGG